MYSIVAKTEELDDLEMAIDELKEQIEKASLKKNSVGIMYVYYDADFDKLATLAHDNFDFPVIGVSTIAMLDKEGYFEYGIELLVLSADDVEFSVGITENLNDENYVEDIEKTYYKIKEERPQEKEAFILTYISKLVTRSGDQYLGVIDRISGGVPVFGGMASDLFKYREFTIFCGKTIQTYGVAFVLMYGNVKPIAVAESSVRNIRSIGKKVTEAKENVLIRMTDESIADVLDREGLSTKDEDGNVALAFMQTPFVVDIPVNESESVEVLRNIVYLNREKGIAQFLGNISVGSTLKISSMHSEDIGKSVNEAFAKLLSRIEKSEEYKYSTLICTSCTGRYINLVGDKDIEAKAYKGIIPDDISIIGMYSYGEVCPIKSQVSDKYFNMFHNETFTILAI